MSALVALAGILLGVTLNSIHVAFLEDAFALFIQQLWRLPVLKARLPESMKSLGPIERFRAIEAQRLKRRCIDDGPAKRFQDFNDGFAATLTFLYCSSYSGLLIAGYQYGSGREVSGLAVSSGIAFLVSALACDFRYTGLDIWGASSYSQT